MADNKRAQRLEKKAAKKTRKAAVKQKESDRYSTDSWQARGSKKVYQRKADRKTRKAAKKTAKATAVRASLPLAPTPKP